MVGPSELRRLWRKYRRYRASKKRRSSQTSLENSSRDSNDSAALEEAKMMVIGLGLDTKEEEEECVAFALEDDPRFLNNPIGIGCSKYYEAPYDSVTMSPLSTSPSSMHHPLMPREISVNGSDEHLPFSKLGPWKPASEDMEKGKRKGRDPSDDAEGRYKYVLDGAASPARFTAKRFKRA